MKGNLQQTTLFNITELYSHWHLSQDGQASNWTPDQSYRSPLCFRKAASKTRPLKCSLFWAWNLIVYLFAIIFVAKNQICRHGRLDWFSQTQSHFLFLAPSMYTLSWNLNNSWIQLHKILKFGSFVILLDPLKIFQNLFVQMLRTTFTVNQRYPHTFP